MSPEKTIIEHGDVFFVMPFYGEPMHRKNIEMSALMVQILS